VRNATSAAIEMALCGELVGDDRVGNALFVRLRSFFLAAVIYLTTGETTCLGSYCTKPKRTIKMNMNEHNFSLEELGAASVVAGLSGKRDREGDSPDAAGGENAWKRYRSEEQTHQAEIEIPYDDEDHEPVPLAQVIINMQRQAAAEAAEAEAAAAASHQQEVVALAPVAPVAPVAAEYEANEDEYLGPYPFYNYKDYSQTPDPDSLTPLTPPGRVPAFPAKMHAILSRPDLKDIIQWQHHGRSWKVLKPREFEVRVIPTYFEHAKFSSFIRQANGTSIVLCYMLFL